MLPGLLGRTREQFAARYCSRRLRQVFRKGPNGSWDNSGRTWDNSGLSCATELHMLLKEVKFRTKFACPQHRSSFFSVVGSIARACKHAGADSNCIEHFIRYNEPPWLDMNYKMSFGAKLSLQSLCQT